MYTNLDADFADAVDLLPATLQEIDIEYTDEFRSSTDIRHDDKLTKALSTLSLRENLKKCSLEAPWRCVFSMQTILRTLRISPSTASLSK